jgi:hypothetical protein
MPVSSYRTSSAEAPPRELDASSLPGATLRRLEAATHGDGCLVLSLRPPLLLSRDALGLLLVLGVTLALAALAPRFGGLEPPRLSRTTRTLALAGGLLSLVGGVALAARARRLRRGMAIDPGVYVFGRDLLDARGPRLVLWPLCGLRELRDEAGRRGADDGAHEGRRLRLVFEGGASFVFPAGSTSAAGLRAELEELRESADLASASGAIERLRWLDPLHDERARWAENPASPAAASDPPSWRVPAALLVAPWLSVLLAPPLVVGRDLASDLTGIALAERAGDDEALRRFADAGGLLAARADRARLSGALASGSPQALSRYLHGGGMRPDEADARLFSAAAADGSVAALERYLALGRARRGEVFEQLLQRGTTSNDVEALHAYVRQHGPREEEVTQGLLPRAQLLSAGNAYFTVAALREHLAASAHPARRAAARHLLAERLDQRLASLPPPAPPPAAPPAPAPDAAAATLDARALLLAARRHDGRATLVVEQAPPAPRRAREAPLPSGSTYSPARLGGEAEQQLSALVRKALAQSLDEALEPGLVALEPPELSEATPSPAGEPLPVLTATYTLDRAPLTEPPVVETIIPLRITLTLAAPGEASPLTRSALTVARITTAERYETVVFCPELRVGCWVQRWRTLFVPLGVDAPQRSVWTG